jgi:hypothetical protein
VGARGTEVFIAAAVVASAIGWMTSGGTAHGARHTAAHTAAAVHPPQIGSVVVALGNVTEVPRQLVPRSVAPVLAWQRLLPRVTFRESSPVEAQLGRPAVVVGALNGSAYGFDLATGATLPGWPVKTGHPINSSPAAADLYGTGNDEIVIGSGSADGSSCGGGGVFAIDPSGKVRWARGGIDASCGHEAFHSSPTLGDITGAGVPDINVGALGLQSWSWDAAGRLNPGWPYYTDDTVFATSALADLSGNGVPDLIMGGDSSPGGTIDYRGGLVRAVTGDGRTLWQFFTDEMIRSSPAIGDLSGGGQPSIVFGTGNYWVGQPGGAKDAYNVYALDATGHREWVRELGGETIAGPALADVEGDGHLDVAIGTANGPQGGLVWVLGPDGRPLPHWAGVPSGGGVVIGGISTADLNGDGAQDVLVPTGSGVFAYDGRTAARLFSLDAGEVGFQSTPLVTTDPDGSVGITVAGTTAFGEGVVQHWVMPAAANATLGTRGWPTFHHDARRTGNVVPPPLTSRSCQGGGVTGYWMAAADGGVFGWCGAGFHGAARGALASPIVAIASTPSGRGYWEASADGGVFAYGDAPFLGTAVGRGLRAPIVSMARTPDGRGYWLASADGGVFGFGDAKYDGSAGGVRLPFPVVALLPTQSGKGYWLIGRQGSVLTYGDAKFFGSPVGVPLSSPIVGGARTPSGLGYWLVSADGGVFTYGDATFEGSVADVHLRAPIVAIAATAAGRGYWLVSADGGIFTYGDARYVGSAAAMHLRGPVVGIAARAG